MTGTFKVNGEVFIFRDDKGNSVSGIPGKFEIWRRGGVLHGEYVNLDEALLCMRYLQ